MQVGQALGALQRWRGQIVTLDAGGAQHLTPAMPKRRKNNPGSSQTAPSRDQAAQRVPAAHPVSPPRSASGQEGLKESFQRAGRLCRLARLPTGPSRKSSSLRSAFGIALQKTALAGRQRAAKPNPELKTVVGLAGVSLRGVFFSGGFGAIGGNSQRGRFVAWDFESCVLACAHLAVSSF